MSGRQFRAMSVICLFWAGLAFEMEAGAQSVRVGTAASAITGGPVMAVQSPGSGLPNAYVDPLTMGMTYGPGIPMTRGQSGLYMLSAAQRASGLGSGQLSGVRPAPGFETASSRAGGTSPGLPPTAQAGNSNVPGGQASRFFHRSNPTSSGPRAYYNRQTRFFPQPPR